MDDSDGGKSDDECVADILVKTPSRFSRITPNQIQLTLHVILCPGQSDRPVRLTLTEVTRGHNRFQRDPHLAKRKSDLHDAGRRRLPCHDPTLPKPLDYDLLPIANRSRVNAAGYAIRTGCVAEFGLCLPLQVNESPAHLLRRPPTRLRRSELPEESIDLGSSVSDSSLGLLTGQPVQLLGLSPRRVPSRLGLTARLSRLGGLAGQRLALCGEARLLTLQPIQQQP